MCIYHFLLMWDIQWWTFGFFSFVFWYHKQCFILAHAFLCMCTGVSLREMPGSGIAASECMQSTFSVLMDPSRVPFIGWEYLCSHNLVNIWCCLTLTLPVLWLKSDMSYKFFLSDYWWGCTYFLIYWLLNISSFVKYHF